MKMRTARVMVALGLSASTVLAWGPHADLTRAALRTIAADDPIRLALGAETGRLDEYCWMPDWRRQIRNGAGDRFYTDDYLLYPERPAHLDHKVPGVRAAWTSYFTRAVQALRTETPANSARWIGTLVHYIEDTGAPPHAYPAVGALHGPMENWVDGRAVNLKSRPPVLLGEDDAAALAGFLRRMERLEKFVCERGEKIYPLAVATNRPAVEPLTLQCAQASAEVVADTLHTLGRLSDITPSGGATLSGTGASPALRGLQKVPAKLMLAGTTFSTLADPAGDVSWRNLPAGRYRLMVLKPGFALLEKDVVLKKASVTALDLAMTPSTPPGNLVRNGDFQLRWIRPDAPDGWYRQKGGWESDPIPVTAGQRLNIAADWAPKAGTNSIIVRWRNTSATAGGQFVTEPPLKAGSPSKKVAVPRRMNLARVLIAMENGDPTNVCSRVSLVAEE